MNILENGMEQNTLAANGAAAAVEDSPENLRLRLDVVNRHFHKKAAAVYGDANSMRLLRRLYKAVVIDIVDFDSGKDGIALAKLTAANFCEIGATVIYITDAGQIFIDSINSDD